MLPTVPWFVQNLPMSFMTGFLNIEDFKSYINKKNDGSFEITEK